MTLFNDIMPYFDEFIHVYGWNMSILWSPLKIGTPQNFTTANFRHPVSKSWLRHWAQLPRTSREIFRWPAIEIRWPMILRSWVNELICWLCNLFSRKPTKYLESVNTTTTLTKKLFVYCLSLSFYLKKIPTLNFFPSFQLPININVHCPFWKINNPFLPTYLPTQFLGLFEETNNF